MEILFENNYLKVLFDASNALVEQRWLSATENMNDAEFRATISEYGKQLEAKRPDKVLVNVVDLNFAVMPETQNWVDENINSIGVKIGLKAVAMLMPKELIAQLSVEQTMEEEQGKALHTRVFSNRQAALDWLFSES